jgi:xanthine permease
VSETSQAVDPVDEILSVGRLAPLAIQHVLVMYAGAVTVPLVVGRALGLDEAQLAMLISADLLACGLVTLLQTIGMPGIGIRLPIMMGVTFVSVSPMLALIGSGLDAGREPLAMLGAIYGGVIAAGVFGLAIAPLVSRMTVLFPPLITGTIILVIGLNLMRVAINWAAGGVPSSPGYGEPANLCLALATLLLILAILRFGKGLARSAAVLLGSIIGTLLAIPLGKAGFAEVGQADWFAIVRPFQFGYPTFELPIIVAMCLVMTVVMIESTGMFLAAGSMVGRSPDRTAITAGLRADAAGAVIGGLFNTFPYSSFAQNVGLIAITGVRSRYVCAAGGEFSYCSGYVRRSPRWQRQSRSACWAGQES